MGTASLRDGHRLTEHPAADRGCLRRGGRARSAGCVCGHGVEGTEWTARSGGCVCVLGGGGETLDGRMDG
eukprot:359744-Chlamydomonas_euryale.AAC.2